MTVQNIAAGTALSGSGAAGRFFLPGASEFADTLNVGQIIQGKVLRGFEGGRYLVAFGKDERVVDSAIPLTTGEILYGRVVGIGERVELQRVYAGQSDRGRTGDSAGVQPSSARGNVAEAAAVDTILQRYQIQLSDAERAVLASAARKADDPEAMGLAGAMLSKLGLPQAGALLDALYRAQLDRSEPASRAGKSPGSRPLSRVDLESAPEVASGPQVTSELQARSIRELAQLLSSIAEAKSAPEGPEARASAADSDGAAASSGESSIPRTLAQAQARSSAAGGGAVGRSRPGEPAAGSAQAGGSAQGGASGQADDVRASLADYLLNAQTGGVVSHRAGLLPLLVGGKLVEVSFALFEQRPGAQRAQTLQHRQILFSLATDSLGRVDVLARMTAGHVRVQITTGSEEQTSQAAGYADLLRSQLSDGGWNVDEVAYGTRAQSAHNPVVRSVIEHVVSLDSLNRLI